MPQGAHESQGVRRQLDPKNDSAPTDAQNADAAAGLRRPTEHGSRQLLTPEETAERLKVSAEHVRALIRSGRLSAVNIGTGLKRPLYRIPASALGDFLSSSHQPAHTTRLPRFKRLPPVEDHFPHLR
jgi:excisionase family DNA binding protein